MKHLSFFWLAFLLAVPGCTDFHGEPLQTPMEIPSVETSLPIEVEAKVSTTVEGTLCTSYRKRLAEHRAALIENRSDAELFARVATFEALITDACQ